MRRLLGAGVALLLLAACRKGSPNGVAAGSTRAPKGDAVRFTDPAAIADAGIEDSLQKIGAVAVFLPVGQAVFENGRWILQGQAPPSRRPERVPAVLVLRAGPETAGAFGGEEGEASKAMARTLAEALKPSLSPGGPYGRVGGVHLDFPFSPETAPSYAAFVHSLRASLPAGTFISIELAGAPSSDADRKKLQPLLDAADGLVAFAFRDGPTVDPAALDALRRPWWPAFAPAGHGVHASADGRQTEGLAEGILDPLTGNPHLDLSNDLSGNEASVSAFHIGIREPTRAEGMTLRSGDRVDFRLPSQTELLYDLGSALAGRRFALGRLIQFEGAKDAQRFLPVAAFEDIVMGRSLTPELDVSVQPAGKNAIVVEAVNTRPHASIVSRVANWIEVDVSPAHPGDVQLGGFDRYEVYDANGRPVTPGRATRVRLFETLIAPKESISPARIVVRGSLPKSCCTHRLHAIAAAGPEVVRDWTAPPATPTPTPRPKKKR